MLHRQAVTKKDQEEPRRARTAGSPQTAGFDRGQPLRLQRMLGNQGVLRLLRFSRPAPAQEEKKDDGLPGAGESVFAAKRDLILSPGARGKDVQQSSTKKILAKRTDGTGKKLPSECRRALRPAALKQSRICRRRQTAEFNDTGMI